jgi:NADH-quinone oxidoreductase subunit G
VQALNKFQEEIAGPLRGGPLGRRLISPGDVDQEGYFVKVPAAFEPPQNEWLVVPIYHIFGSEELSVLTHGIRELAPEPYLALNPEDAASLPAEAGEEVSLDIEGIVYQLPVRLLSTLPRGLAGLPVGLPALPGIGQPARGVRVPVHGAERIRSGKG